MIQAMKILQCPMQELQEQIEQELDENVLLEVVEDQDTPEANDNQEATNGSTDSPSGETAVNDSSPELSLDNMEAKLEAQIEKEIDDLEERTQPLGRVSPNVEEADRRYELLYNTPGPAGSLADHHILDRCRPHLPGRSDLPGGAELGAHVLAGEVPGRIVPMVPDPEHVSAVHDHHAVDQPPDPFRVRQQLGRLG